MWGHDLRRRRDIGLRFSGFDPDCISSFLAHYSAINPLAPGLAGQSPGRVYAGDDLIERHAFLRTEFYNDWVAPQDDIQAGRGVNLFNDGPRFFALAGNFNPRDDERLGLPLTRLLSEVAPHLKRSFSLMRSFGDSIVRSDYEQFLNVLSSAVIVLDSKGQACHINPKAAELIERGTLLSLSKAGEPGFLDPVADAQMDKVREAIAASSPAEIPHSLSATDVRHLLSYEVTVVPFSGREQLEDEFPEFNLQLRPAAIMCLELADTPDEIARKLLASRYRLTRTEADLAWALFQGMTLNEIAEQRGVSIHTVRNQIKAVFLKTEVSRQSELVRLVAGLANPHLDTKD
ncbi:helix-turn-helix transcriptional regulator [Cucumibacter marinus]|uniref:helix-turn-helix transcriptional regulator n=1 Tax=Cucumibacter marinus TaxID=1121252 RepID=UPI00040A7F5F|nr:helix-turn-helix transcriptional regulator [Cucumibacter marinus]